RAGGARDRDGCAPAPAGAAQHGAGHAMKLRHPFTRAVYETVDDGLVRVDAGAGRVGLFHPDGRWHSGALREADPHLLGWVGGPKLASATPKARADVESLERPDADPKSLSYQDLLDRDTRPVPDVLRWQSPADLPVVRVPIERYTSRAFHEREVERLWH